MSGGALRPDLAPSSRGRGSEADRGCGGLSLVTLHFSPVGFNLVRFWGHCTPVCLGMPDHVLWERESLTAARRKFMDGIYEEGHLEGCMSLKPTGGG